MRPFTEKPLVILGATGRLSSDLLFYSLLKDFSRHIVLSGGDMTRLQGLKDEVEESGFGDLRIDLTLSIDEALSYGGYVVYAKSVPGGAKTREEMLLQNADFAVQAGRAMSRHRDKIERVVCVSNPSDLMGLILLIHSHIDPSKVMSLSALDTERFRRSLKRRFGVTESDLDTVYTLGSHDLMMAPMLDMAKIKGRSLHQLGYTKTEREDIVREVRNAGISIYKQRGQTAYQSPAVQVLKMLMATDENPFLLPTARYHNSKRYPYTFGAFVTMIDSSGCRHLPCQLSSDDAQRLDGAFRSIEVMRDTLIQEGFLPAIEAWEDGLHETSELITIE